MNGLILLIPFLLIRFGLLGILNKEGLQRAAYFAPRVRKEKTAYLLYEISNSLFLVYLFFLKITADTKWLYPGLAVYAAGVILCMISMVDFAKPADNGINRNGIYRFSRNPMYVSYFIFFLGCVLLTQSLILFIMLLVFQISAHWIILSEERWCVQKFGEEYRDYMNSVRRYI